MRSPRGRAFPAVVLLMAAFGVPLTLSGSAAQPSSNLAARSDIRGTYAVINACGGKALDVKDLGQADGAVAQTWEYVGNANQQWTLVADEQGHYKLIARHSGKVLDVQNAGADNGALVQQWADTSVANQRWLLHDLGGGAVGFAPLHAPHLRLDVRDGNAGNGARVQLWSANPGCAQRWTLKQIARLPAGAGPAGLTVASDRRHLVRADGTPFIYLADTAWELFHRLDRREAVHYLRTRQAQGFTVVQAVALAELDGLSSPNAHGDLPLVNRDPARPAVTPGNDANHAGSYDYWDHVDYIVGQAAALGLHVALLPTWGSWVEEQRVFDVSSAHAYGAFLGQRYRDRPVIWLLGGDRAPSEQAKPIWRAMARGIEEGAGGRDAALISYHPSAVKSSGEWFHDDPWLDFNTWQTGHCRDVPIWDRIAQSLAYGPPKPVLNAEPIYEAHPVCFSAQNGYSDAVDARNAAYWSVLSGALGHAYGHHSVWQMYTPAHAGVNGPTTRWREALNAAGAAQMRHLRRLLEARPQTGRAPDPELVTSAYSGADRIQAARGEGYALIYSATGRPVTVRLERLAALSFKGYWYDPRTGQATALGKFAAAGTRTFTPPTRGRGHDWVLVLDDANRGYPAPGSLTRPTGAP